MRRLLRWTFNALAAASLLLCLATAVLWVRSYWVEDQFFANRREASESARIYHWLHYQSFAASFDGKLAVWFCWSERPESGPRPPWEVHFTHTNESWTEFAAGAAQFKYVNYDGYASDFRIWVVRDWSLVAAFAVLPAIVALRQVRAVRRRRRRARLGLCPACGYDLRASPDRCPECGRADDKVTR